MPLDIVTYPAEVLRKPADAVPAIDAAVVDLAEAMLDTMYAAPGVGLAAPQVGHSVRLFVMDPQPEGKKNPAVFINPVIVEREGEIVWEEGCLSIPGFSAEVKRSEKVLVAAWTVQGREQRVELAGFPAVIAQHEIDHLDGVLFVDYLSPLRWRLFEKDFGRDPFRWKYAHRQR